MTLATGNSDNRQTSSSRKESANGSSIPRILTDSGD
jgi:hypothetical protein